MTSFLMFFSIFTASVIVAALRADNRSGPNGVHIPRGPFA